MSLIAHFFCESARHWIKPVSFECDWRGTDRFPTNPSATFSPNANPPKDGFTAIGLDAGICDVGLICNFGVAVKTRRAKLLWCRLKQTDAPTQFGGSENRDVTRPDPLRGQGFSVVYDLLVVHDIVDQLNR